MFSLPASIYFRLGLIILLWASIQDKLRKYAANSTKHSFPAAYFGC
jgi:hypothetical protein